MFEFFKIVAVMGTVTTVILGAICLSDVLRYRRVTVFADHMDVHGVQMTASSLWVAILSSIVVAISLVILMFMGWHWAFPFLTVMALVAAYAARRVRIHVRNDIYPRIKALEEESLRKQAQVWNDQWDAEEAARKAERDAKQAEEDRRRAKIDDCKQFVRESLSEEIETIAGQVATADDRESLLAALVECISEQAESN